MGEQKTFSQKIARAILRSGLRGRTRLTLFLSRFSNKLRCAPTTTADGHTLFLNLGIASSHGLYTEERLEQSERMIMKKCVRQGDVVLDVGAHWGLHTTLLASLVGCRGKVFAFEPNQSIARLLRRTVEGLKNVSLHELALSNQDGTCDFFVPLDASMGSLVNWTQGDNIETFSCPMRRLETLTDDGIHSPDFVKCDVEGAELRFFEGAASILSREDAPTILFEENCAAATAFGESPDASARFLQHLGNAAYKLFVVDSSGDLVPYVGATGNQSVRSLLAVPARRAEHVLRLAVTEKTCR